jgi:hypothetical protein
MSKYWFKPKRFGYGFYPISWEGWLCIFIFVGFIILAMWIDNLFNPLITNQDAWRFFLDVIILASIATFFFEKKTAGKLKWNWSWEDKE